MKIEDFIQKSPNLEPIQHAIEAVWLQFQREYHWVCKAPRLGKNTLTKVIKGQSLVDEETNGELDGYGLKENLIKIASNWNWKRNPAPIQLLEGEKVWKALAAAATISKQEKEASNKEALESAIRWAKSQVEARQNKTNSKEEIIREITEAAHALGRLEDLSNSQIQIWSENLKKFCENLKTELEPWGN